MRYLFVTWVFFSSSISPCAYAQLLPNRHTSLSTQYLHISVLIFWMNSGYGLLLYLKLIFRFVSCDEFIWYLSLYLLHGINSLLVTHIWFWARDNNFRWFSQFFWWKKPELYFWLSYCWYSPDFAVVQSLLELSTLMC